MAAETESETGTVTVTVVFTDLVGSTELMARVGEVHAEALRREYFSLLRLAVAETGGREVKNLGDGLMVAFDGVVPALRCAVEMQQVLTARPADREPLSIRVGIAVGEADREDGDYFGLPVIEAARLCAVAGPGEILASGLVQVMARRRTDLDLELVGDLELKGLAEPLRTHRVRWEPLEQRVDAMVRFISIDDHPVIGDAIARVAGTQDVVEFVGSFSSIDSVPTPMRSPDHFDVALLDLNLPGVDGVEGVRAVAEWGVHVLVFSALADPERAKMVIDAGAAGFVGKGTPTDEVLSAIARVAAGATVTLGIGD